MESRAWLWTIVGNVCLQWHRPYTLYIYGFCGVCGALSVVSAYCFSFSHCSGYTMLNCLHLPNTPYFSSSSSNCCPISATFSYSSRYCWTCPPELSEISLAVRYTMTNQSIKESTISYVTFTVNTSIISFTETAGYSIIYSTGSFILTC